MCVKYNYVFVLINHILYIDISLGRLGQCNYHIINVKVSSLNTEDYN